MNPNLEQQFKQDARAIQAQAEARLDNKDFSKNIESLLIKPTKRQHPPWLVAVAAAICLTVLTWLTWQNTELTAVNEPELLVLETMEFNLDQFPKSMEQKFNQPLAKEQQAIIADLKALREQLLSI